LSINVSSSPCLVAASHRTIQFLFLLRSGTGLLFSFSLQKYLGHNAVDLRFRQETVNQPSSRGHVNYANKQPTESPCSIVHCWLHDGLYTRIYYELVVTLHLCELYSFHFRTQGLKASFEIYLVFTTKGFTLVLHSLSLSLSLSFSTFVPASAYPLFYHLALA
jgi:hypothetical protein